MQYFIVFLLLGGLLSGCASTPEFDTSGVDRSLDPATVIQQQELSLNKQVLWGGTILVVENMKDSTQIEVLSYPLGSNYRPDLEKKPLGRFLIREEGFLEPETYVQGRQITVVGKVGKAVNGKVGESEYRFPLIHAQQLQLWSSEDKVRTNFQFGIGIRL